MSDPLRWHVDPDTLREVAADPEAVRERVPQLRAEVRDADDEIDELRARADLVDALRVLDELDDALVEAQRAADRADIAGNAAQQHIARARLAQVHTWRGEFAHSNPVFTELLAVATQFGPVIEAFTHQHAGLNDFEQEHWGDARDHFARAVDLRARFELPETEESRVALAAAERRSGTA